MRFDYYELIAISAVLLGVAVIAGIVYTYDVSRQARWDDVQTQAYFDGKQLHHNY